MRYIPPVLALLLVFVLALLLMWWGWRSRAARQADLPAPDPDEDLRTLDGGRVAGPFPAVYVSTVLASRPFERVTAHGLGARSRAQVSLGAAGSWRLEREGAPSLTIHGDHVLAVAAAPGMAGKVIGGDGLLVVRWQHGPDAVALETGLRLSSREDHDRLLALGRDQTIRPHQQEAA